MDLIKMYAANEFINIFKKAIARYAEKYKTTHERLFIMLRVDKPGEEGNVLYNILVDDNNGKPYRVIEEVSILDLLNVKHFHIKKYHQFAPPYIMAAINNLAITNGLIADRVAIVVQTDTEKIFLLLYEWLPDEKNGLWQLSNYVGQLENITDLF